MSTAKRKDAWDRTALIACVLANANRDPKKRPRPYTPEDFHPFRDGTAKKNGVSLKQTGIKALGIFIKK